MKGDTSLSQVKPVCSNESRWEGGGWNSSHQSSRYRNKESIVLASVFMYTARW